MWQDYTAIAEKMFPIICERMPPGGTIPRYKVHQWSSSLASELP